MGGVGGCFEVGTKYDLKTEVQEKITMLKPKSNNGHDLFSNI